MPLGMLDGDEDDDDFESLTPRSIRLRNSTPPPKRPAPTLSSKQQRQRPRQQSQQQKQQKQQKQDRSLSTHALKRPQSDLSERMSTPTSSQTSVTATPSTSKPRTGLPLSLKKPMPKSNPSSQVATRTIDYPATTAATPGYLSNSPKLRDKEAVMIVLDSESEVDSDLDTDCHVTPPSLCPEIALGSTQIGGVLSNQPLSRTDSGQNYKRTPPILIPSTKIQNTQESIASSQGSIDHYQEHDRLDDDFPLIKDPEPRSPVFDEQDTRMDCAQDSEDRWSLSPRIENPHLSDLIAATASPVASTGSPSTGSASTVAAPSSPEPLVIDDDDNDDDEASVHTAYRVDVSVTSPMQTDDYLPSTLGGDDIIECVVCGKLLTHLDPARVDYHINNCIDEQQQQQQDAAQFLDQKANPPRISTSHTEFAGAQVDYLARVRTCPICKLDWPSKGKAKTGAGTHTRKARQKVEHMKRCAKANKRTIQSVLYQVRLLKERYERSLVLGTPMESASQDVGGESKSDEEDRSSDETNHIESRPKACRKLKINNTVTKQVVSLSDNADTDFASDAIITMVHVPVVTQSKLTKLQRMHQDQQDDGLQMALAISMSMCDTDSGTLAGSNSESSSGNQGSSSSWTMASAVVRKGVKRRKQTERDRNETTVLPFAEVQHLIQNNVHSLLFPETDDSAPARFSADDGISTGAMVKTPPWGPSRFSGDAEDVDVEVNLSQTSELGTASPTKSLWNLSHLKDTRDGSLEDATMRGVREASVALVQAGSGLEFDKEKYVTRFMRRYIREGQNIREGSKSAEPASPQQESSKYTSPLWSVSKSRRISFREQRKGQEGESVIALKSEIVGHLDEMQRSIEQAKQVAYVKILESIERNPVAAARLTPPKYCNPIIVEESKAKDDIVDEDTIFLSQNIYQGPSSPLLRYSKVSEQERSVSPLLPDSLPATSPSPRDLVEDADSPIREALSQDLNRSCNMDDTVNDLAMDDYDAYQGDNYAYSSGVIVYSPSPSPRPLSPQQLASPQPASPPPVVRAMNPYDFSELSPPPEIEPPKTPVKPSRRKKAIRAPSSSSPDLLLGELPPPLDFAKMGYHKADELTDLATSDNEATGGWDDVKTPKKSRRSNKAAGGNSSLKLPRRPRNTYKIGKTLPVQTQSQQETLKHNLPTAASISVRLEPLPPTSAVGGEGGLEELGNWPTASQLIAARRAATLQGDGQEQQQSSSQALASSHRSTVPSQSIPSPRRPVVYSQSAMSPRRPASGRPGSDLVESYRKAATRARNAANGTLQAMVHSQPQAGSQSQIQTQTQSLSQAAPQTPTNKAARARAQEFAAAAARAVETMKAQESMPRYDMMSVSTLRMLGVGFGLKATSKKMLSEQLTAIWERVHEGTPKADQQEGEGVQTENSSSGESSSRGVQLQQNNRWEPNQDEPTATSSPFLDQDDRTASPPLLQYMDDTAPGYMSPILSDNDHTYDHMFDNDNHYDSNYDMAYDNHSDGYEYGLDKDAGSDRGETFVHTKRGGGGGSTAKFGGGSQHKESLCKDDDDVDGGAYGDRGSSSSDQDDFSQLSRDEDDEEHGGEDMEEASDQEELGITPPTLEHQLFDFLSKASHLRKQYLVYKPLDLEQVWEECSAAQIRCTRQQLRQFLDRQSIICFVPAHSTLQSWRKTRAKKQKRAHP
ncbi:hypothetical protein BGZ96_001824 [Linnemannia gamsii]|uniref:Structure-specific endonuclease subunit SLX4 n=1 Tax=Linnemannia gamsii TaxID=64522 RepID=A0ABQ7K8P3_9FUNG|nr:hypothetical protein BGZ96_001824 [Linnemannia gamsii]